jgi:hypothetical protein
MIYKLLNIESKITQLSELMEVNPKTDTMD